MKAEMVAAFFAGVYQENAGGAHSAAATAYHRWRLVRIAAHCAAWADL